MAHFPPPVAARPQVDVFTDVHAVLDPSLGKYDSGDPYTYYYTYFMTRDATQPLPRRDMLNEALTEACFDNDHVSVDYYITQGAVMCFHCSGRECLAVRSTTSANNE